MPRQSEYRSAMSHSHVLAVSQSIAATQTARGGDALASTGPLTGTQLTVKVVCYSSSWPQPYSTSTTPTSRSLDKPGPSETPSCGLSKAHYGMSSTAAISDVAGFHEHRTEAHKFATQRVFLHAFGMRMRASTTFATLHPRGNGLRSKASWPSAAQPLHFCHLSSSDPVWKRNRTTLIGTLIVPSHCGPLESVRGQTENPSQCPGVLLCVLLVHVARGSRAQKIVLRRAQTAPPLVRFEPSEFCAPSLQIARRFRAPWTDPARARWPR